MVDDHRFDVFGRVVVIRREANQWQAYAVGPEGTRVPAGFVVPDFVEDAELEQFLFDLFHESATPGNGEVRRIPSPAPSVRPQKVPPCQANSRT